jgi:hypothetical protein
MSKGSHRLSSRNAASARVDYFSHIHLTGTVAYCGLIDIAGFDRSNKTLVEEPNVF